MDWPIDWGGGGVITESFDNSLTLYWIGLLIGVEVAL